MIKNELIMNTVPTSSYSNLFSRSVLICSDPRSDLSCNNYSPILNPKTPLGGACEEKEIYFKDFIRSCRLCIRSPKG